MIFHTAKLAGDLSGDVRRDVMHDVQDICILPINRVIKFAYGKEPNKRNTRVMFYEQESYLECIKSIGTWAKYDRVSLVILTDRDKPMNWSHEFHEPLQAGFALHNELPTYLQDGSNNRKERYNGVKDYDIDLFERTLCFRCEDSEGKLSGLITLQFNGDYAFGDAVRSAIHNREPGRSVVCDIEGTPESEQPTISHIPSNWGSVSSCKFLTI